jgi:radical SAM protein with 4Fe4S-binding SPASM domain
MDMHSRGTEVEVLTVDNHTDGAYLVLWAQQNAPHRVPEMRRLLTRNGGNSAGKGIGNIDERGNVHPDQFWRAQTLGNVRDRPFSEIWHDDEIPLLKNLRFRHKFLPKMCIECTFLSVCNGNLRARAEAATGDPWGEDPACYLTDAERAGIEDMVTA